MPDTLHILHSLVLTASALEINGQAFWRAEGASDFSDNLKGLYKQLEPAYPKFYKMDILSKFGFLAAEALLSRCHDKEDWDASKTGVFLTNATSSLDTDQRYFATVDTAGENLPSPALFVYTLPNILIGEICIRHKFTGEQVFFVSSHFDSEYLYPYLTQLFQQGHLDRALVGWIEIAATKPIAKMVLLCKDSVPNSRPFAPGEMDTFFKNEY